MRTALLYVCIALTLACSTHTEPSAADWKAAAIRWRTAYLRMSEMLHTSVGFTFWDCRYPEPVYYLRGGWTDSTWVERHEQRHITQALRHTCEEWQMIGMDPIARARMELDAERHERRGQP